MIRLVAFDLDDTLYPEVDYVKSGFRAVSPVLSRWAGIPRRRAEEELWEAFCAERHKAFDRVLEKYGCFAPERVAFLLAVYRSHLPRLALFPDGKEALHFLSSRPVKVAVLTAGWHFAQAQKVRALGLYQYLDVVVYTDLLGSRDFWKPNPLGYQLLLRRAGCQGSEAVYVGDNPVKDFRGAGDEGLLTVWVRRVGGLYSGLEPPAGSEPDFVVGNLEEALSLLPVP